MSEICLTPEQHPLCVADIRRRWVALCHSRWDRSIQPLHLGGVYAVFDVRFDRPMPYQEPVWFISVLCGYFRAGANTGYVLGSDETRVRMRAAAVAFHGWSRETLNAKLREEWNKAPTERTPLQVVHLENVRFVYLPLLGPTWYDTVLALCCHRFYPGAPSAEHWHDTDEPAPLERAAKKRKKQKAHKLWLLLAFLFLFVCWLVWARTE